MSTRNRLVLGVSAISKDSAYEQFTLFQTVKNVAPVTLKNYNNARKYFNLFHEGTLEEITKADIQDYILFMKKQNMKDVTINSLSEIPQIYPLLLHV